MIIRFIGVTTVLMTTALLFQFIIGALAAHFNAQGTGALVAFLLGGAVGGLTGIGIVFWLVYSITRQGSPR